MPNTTLTEDEVRENEIYQRKVAVTLLQYGLPLDTSTGDLLDHIRKHRAAACGITTDDPDWFEVFCTEIKNGIDPELPQLAGENWPNLRQWEIDFWDWSGDRELDDPDKALWLAQLAGEHFGLYVPGTDTDD